MPLLQPVKSWSRRFLCEIALAAALCLHVLVFGLLYVRPPQARAGEKDAADDCISFRADNGGQWERQLAALCDLRNPALLAEADPAHGFSIFLNEPPPTPVTPLNQPPPEPSRQPARFYPVHPAAESLPPMTDAIGRHWPATLPAERSPVRSAALPARVLWRFADGTPMAAPPAPDEEAVRKAAADKAPTGPVRFEIRLAAPPLQARLLLVDSCGNAKLDELALQALNRRMCRWERAHVAHLADPDLPRFTPENGSTQIIEAEWRLLGPPP